MQNEKLKFTGLKNVLKKFDDHKWVGSFTSGDWKIANGGYDLWFELYYQNQPVAQCINGELSSGFGLDQLDKQKLFDKVLEIYDHLKIEVSHKTNSIDMLIGEAEEQKKVFENSGNMQESGVKAPEKQEAVGGKDYARTADMIEQVEKLNDNTPDGVIIDADTILVDLIQECDFKFTGLSQDIFDIWKNSSDKQAVEQMFYEFTDMEFDQYLMKCNEEITRSEQVARRMPALEEQINAAEASKAVRNEELGVRSVKDEPTL